jgi:tetratricopeptide (TPR) repeat protein
MPHDQAIAHFDQKVQDSPSAINHYHRGLAWQAIGDVEKAIADYGRAMEIAPEVAAYYVIRGNAWNDKGEHDKAIADYDEAIRLEPSGAAYHGRGDASFEKGDYEQAIADYSQAIESDPESIIALNNRGTALLKQGQRDAAIADYDEAIRLDPTFAPAYGTRGRAKAEMGRYDEALADFTKAIELNPNDHWPYNDLAWAWAILPDPQPDDAQNAIESATKACELTNWQDSTIVTTLAAAYAQAGDFDAAVQWMEKAMGIDELDRDKRGKMLAYFQQQKPYRE